MGVGVGDRHTSVDVNLESEVDCHHSLANTIFLSNGIRWGSLPLPPHPTFSPFPRGEGFFS